MELYLIRHAEAAAAGENGVSDEDRPLTSCGEGQATALGKALRGHGIELRLLISSPLLRARQTAEALLREWREPKPDFRVYKELALGGKRRPLLRALREQGADKVAIVGHEPELGDLAAYLLGSKKLHIALDKAAVAALHCRAGLEKGDGQLNWLLPPAWYTA
jgi:phosphohistidine phosphatase